MQRRPTSVEEAHAPAMARGADCLNCPLYGCGQGPVLGDITLNSKLAIIIDAPAREDVEVGRPLSGRAGELVYESTRQGGVADHQTSATPAIACRPPEEMQQYLWRLNRSHKKAVARAKEQGLPAPAQPKSPFEACRPRLVHNLQEAGAGFRLMLRLGRRRYDRLDGAAFTHVPDHVGAA